MCGGLYDIIPCRLKRLHIADDLPNFALVGAIESVEKHLGGEIPQKLTAVKVRRV
jgi:hypothetical protein